MPTGETEPETSSGARVPTPVMAVATGVAVASIYYNQPMLGLIAREFPGSGAAGIIPTVTQLGYAVGLAFLVPLGDVVERRRLILAQFCALAAALAVTASAPSVPLLAVASVLLGTGASVAQQIVPFAAHLAPPSRRGAVVGSVMAGLLGGILLSRTAAGFVAGHYGWRAVFWIAAPIVLVLDLALAGFLPRSHPESSVPYARLLRSILGLWTEFAELRRAAFTQALLFAAFSAFWTVLSLRLERPEFGLGPTAAGLFGVVGLVGILAAPLSGRLADRRGPHLVVVTGAAVTLLAWVVFGVWGTIAGLVFGVILLDFGVQSALVSNQHIIYALRPESRARVNSAFMVVMFLGGAIGSASSTAAWRLGGWTAVTALGAALSALAAVVQGFTLRARRRA